MEKVYIVWVDEKVSDEEQPIVWSIHKTEKGAMEELRKHQDGFIIDYRIKD